MTVASILLAQEAQLSIQSKRSITTGIPTQVFDSIFYFIKLENMLKPETLKSETGYEYVGEEGNYFGKAWDIDIKDHHGITWAAKVVNSWMMMN